MEKAIIAAVADNLAIGKNNALLWHISEDMQYFKQQTSGYPVIMGYMTFKSLGEKALPRRKNIVISTLPLENIPENITVVKSLEEAYEAAGNVEKCFVIGGGYTYREAMQTADTLYITHVHTTIDNADTFFPEINPNIWETVSESQNKKDSESGYIFQFIIYKRKKK